MMTVTSMGRVAVVTGSNKGIGFHIAKHLAVCGLFQHIILACRDTALGETARQSILSSISASSSTATAITTQLHVESLTVGDVNSHAQFAARMAENFGRIDCLVNNAAIAFKNADPTPFAGQTKPTLDVNFRGTVQLTDTLLPLIRTGTTDPRIVNVASMAGRLSQVSPALQQQLSSTTLTFPELHGLIDAFEAATRNGTHQQCGYSNSNYGMSKLAVIAATKIWARENPTIKVNCCCPGYCRTDMTSLQGIRDPAEGAKNAVIPATVDNPPTGAYYANYVVAEW
jgi:carbonyl reductase 1